MCLITGLCLFIIGVCLILLSQTQTITGAVVGVSTSANKFCIISGGTLVFFSCFLMVFGLKKENLDDRVHSHWKKYRVSASSVLQDIEQEYLGNVIKKEETEVQENIEKIVNYGKPISQDNTNKKQSYEEQFYEGHASQGGRVIDVESHIKKTGVDKGKLIHFGQPANARYIWVVDEDKNFVIANKQTMQHDLPLMNSFKIDYSHRLHKLPHATLAKGKKIYGSGEVLIEGGKVKSFNTASGHYLDIKNIEEFNQQGEFVFRYFVKRAGWKEVDSGAKHEIKK